MTFTSFFLCYHSVVSFMLSLILISEPLLYCCFHHCSCNSSDNSFLKRINSIINNSRQIMVNYLVKKFSNVTDFFIYTYCALPRLSSLFYDCCLQNCLILLKLFSKFAMQMFVKNYFKHRILLLKYYQ